MNLTTSSQPRRWVWGLNQQDLASKMSKGFLGRHRRQQKWLCASFHQYRSISFQVPLYITRHLSSSDVVGIYHHLIRSVFPEGGTSGALDPARPLRRSTHPPTGEGRSPTHWTGVQGEAGATGNTVTVKINGPSTARATLVVFCSLCWRAITL